MSLGPLYLAIAAGVALRGMADDVVEGERVRPLTIFADLLIGLTWPLLLLTLFIGTVWPQRYDHG